ncbi:hypothetical protein [Mesorhizobium sp. CN2-181]|uniref:hypothetical protein n=1 Tax=Mesorhizobium yinganensis TaxID=3157707 RepID=UPI0032B6FE5F
MTITQRPAPATSRVRSHPELVREIADAARRAFAGAETPWDPRRDRREVPDPGRGLIDCYALPLHVLWTYQEEWAREGFLPCLRLDASRKRLLELVATPPTPGLAASGLQHFVIKPGRSATLPPEFRLTAPAAGGRPEAQFETLKAAELSHERNAFLPYLPTVLPALDTAGSIAASAQLLDPEIFVPPPGAPLLPQLERRLAAGLAGDVARRNADRMRTRALQRAETLRELQETGAIDPFSEAFQTLCAEVCAAQSLANEVPADAEFGPLSEAQEMLLGQFGKMARRQPSAMAGLESALARQASESDADWSRRLDQTTGFLDALVNGLMQDARDQMVRLYGPGKLSRLDRALRAPGDGAPGQPPRGFAPVGTDTVFLLSSLDESRAERTQSTFLRTGDWLVVAETSRTILANGDVREDIAYRQAVQVMRVSEAVPDGRSLAMTQLTFRPALSRAMWLSDTMILGNIVPVSHGKTVRRTVTRAQIGAAGLVLTGDPLTWLPDPLAPAGRKTQVSLRISGQVWTEVPIAAISEAPPGAFFLAIDAEGVARLRIGAGDVDAPIPADAPIEISYRVGSGPDGNRASGAVSEVATAHSAIAATFNPLPMEGGIAAETAEEALEAGIAASVLDRAVSVADARRLALNYGSVRRAAVRRHRRRGGTVEARERLDIVVSGIAGAELSAVELSDLTAFLLARVPPGIALDVRNRQIAPILSRLRLRVEPGASPLAVIAEARARLGYDPADPPGLLDPSKVELGQTLNLSDLHRALSGIPGLASLHVEAFHRGGERFPRRADRIAVDFAELPLWARRSANAEPLDIRWEEARDLP